MGTGFAGVSTTARKNRAFGETDATARYTPGVIHWEADKAYIYYESVDANADGECLYRTGTASIPLQLQPAAADTGQKVIGVAVSDVASGYYAWAQIYGPHSYVQRYTAEVALINSFVIGIDDSQGCRPQTEDSPTYVGGVFGYVIETYGTTVNDVSVYLNCL